MTDPAPQSSAVPPAPRRRSLVVRVLKLWPFPALALLVLAAVGFQRQSAGGAAGVGLSGETSAASAAAVRKDGRFRVGVYNIQGAVGKDDQPSVDALAKVTADADLCGLTEIRANAWHRDNRNQARQIGESLGRTWLYAPAERRFWTDGIGNGVVSRLPVGRWVRLPLPDAGDSSGQRNVVLLEADVAGRTVTVLVSHVDRGPARVPQMAAVTQLFQSLTGPAVLLADLNADPLDPLVAPLLATPGAVDPIGTIIGVKEKRVDWILCKGLKVLDAGRTDDPSTSDHSFFWADLRVPDVERK